VKACSIARIGESANADFYQVGSKYAVFLTNIYGNTTAEQKNIVIVQKNVDSLKMSVIYLKVSRAQNGF
jgi:hypothetical protein